MLQVLRSGWLSMGQVTAAFEAEFAAALGARHALAVANGTDALMLAYLALGLGPGDEIIQPAVNFVAAANTAIRVGARPVFADICSPDEPTLDPAALPACLTPATKAVVVMHYGGAPCRMDEIGAFCRAHGLFLIEDACHGVGGSYHGRAMGTLGEIGAFSFYSNKNLPTGEGGMLTTENDDLAAKLKLLRSHGMTTLTWDRHRGHAASYDVVLNGLNCRIDEIHAALGREQLKKLARHNDHRRALAREYHRLFRDELTLPRERGWLMPALGVDGEEAAHHLMIVLAPGRPQRDAAMEHLKSQGIQTSIHYPFIPDFTAFREYSHTPGMPSSLAKSREFCDRVLSLPLHPLLSFEDVRTVLQTLSAHVAEHTRT